MAYVQRHEGKFVLTGLPAFATKPMWKRLLLSGPVLLALQFLAICIQTVLLVVACVFALMWFMGIWGGTSPKETMLLVFAICFVLFATLCKKIVLYIKNQRMAR